jgi:hypothetical protein
VRPRLGESKPSLSPPELEPPEELEMAGFLISVRPLPRALGLGAGVIAPVRQTGNCGPSGYAGVLICWQCSAD